MELLMIWLLLLPAAFCIVRGIADLRARRFVWGALGLAAGALLILTPIPTHAVKIDLPPGGGR